MNKAGKILIVTALIVVVGIVLAIKQQAKNSVPAPTVVTSSMPVATTQQAADNSKNLPTILDLGADKCVPCRMMFPILDELKKDYGGKLNVEFIDVWKNPTEGQKYGISMIPTQIFYDATGKELFRHTGFFSKTDILAKWKELGFNLQGKDK